MKPRVLLIDDDPVSLLVNEKVLLRLFGQDRFDKIEKFLQPELALPSILREINAAENTVFWIFLDINMPVMNGFEVLDALHAEDLGEQVHVFMLSSSINPQDREKAMSYALVKKYFTKPLSVSVEEVLKSFL